MTVKQLTNELDAREFDYWLAYSTIHPFGCVALDVRHAYMMATQSTERGKTLGDFQPYWCKPDKDDWRGQRAQWHARMRANQTK